MSLKSFLQDRKRSFKFSWSADKWEKHRKSQDTCLLRREAWEEQTRHESQNDRSGAGSWPHGSTEGVVANAFALERSGVEENRGLWHAPGGMVADCSVSPKDKRPSLRSWEIWYQEQSTGRQVRRKKSASYQGPGCCGKDAEHWYLDLVLVVDGFEYAEQGCSQPFEGWS